MANVFLLRARCHAFPDPVDLKDVGLAGQSDGIVLVFPVKDEAEWNAVRPRFAELRRRLPDVPFALLTEGARPAIAARLGAHGLLAGTRAIINDRNDLTNLHEQLTDADLLPRHQLIWLQHMYIVPRGPCSEVALRLLQEASRHATFHNTAKRIQRNPDRLEDLFREVGAAISPGHLCSLVRWTKSALVLQRSDQSIRQVAIEVLGYRNPHSFTAGCRRMFGAPPTEIRRWLGFEPLFAAYLSRTSGDGTVGIR